MKKFLLIFCLFLSITSYADWGNEQKLLANDGDLGDQFSIALSLDEVYAIIGATGDDDNGANSGSAYIYIKEGTTWIQQAKLVPSDGDEEDHFGASVSISEDYAVVGAPWDEENGGGSGSVYIFRRDGTNWTEEIKIIPSDGEESDWFGQVVSISGDYILISAYGDDDNGSKSGSAYIYFNDGANWVQQAKISPADGETEDWFSYSLFLSGDYAIIGCERDDDNGDDSGSAYLFQRNGTSWEEQAKLIASDGETYDWFGCSVSMFGNYITVGAYGDDDHGEKSGSAYVFYYDGTNWTEQAKLTASDGEINDWFGFSVSISGDYLVVGSLSNDFGDNSGAVYIFKRNETLWTFQEKITASDGAEGDFFGRTVAIYDDYMLASSFHDDDNGVQSGSAYFYSKDGVSIKEDFVNYTGNTRLIDNYPNPFISSTKISFEVTQTASHLTLAIYNIECQLVKTLINDWISPGRYSIMWNGKNDNNQYESPGLYFYKMTSGNYLEVKKMILIK